MSKLVVSWLVGGRDVLVRHTSSCVTSRAG
jgi:hypothetical protein